MGFIDRQPLHPRARQALGQAGLYKPLRRHEEQAQRATVDVVPGLVGLGLLARGIERRGRHADGVHLLHLIAHQRDQRRDDKRQPTLQHGRKLVAHRLPAAGRHHRQDVVPDEHMTQHLVLSGPEILIAENLLQRGARGCEIAHQRTRSARPGPMANTLAPSGRLSNNAMSAPVIHACAPSSVKTP
jgi:hypothetical protein